MANVERSDIDYLFLKSQDAKYYPHVDVLDKMFMLDNFMPLKVNNFYPSTPNMEEMTIQSLTSSFVSTAQSKVRQVRSFGGQRWVLKGVYTALTRDEFAPIWAFCLRQRGQYGKFIVVPPDNVAVPRGNVSGSTPMTCQAQTSGNVLQTDGWVANTTVLKAGDFFRLSGHAKVYAVIQDILSDNTGKAALSFEPPLHDNVADNEIVTVTGIPFTVSFTGDVREFQLKTPGLYDYEVEFLEVPL